MDMGELPSKFARLTVPEAELGEEFRGIGLGNTGLGTSSVSFLASALSPED